MRLNILFTIGILALLTVCGCHDDNVTYTFPTDIKDLCYGALHNSKACIEQVLNKELKTEHSCSVVKNMTCDKKLGGYWCWFDSTWKMHVGGLYYYGKRIEIGCNPVNGGEVNGEVCKHEFGHHWLAFNVTNDGKHDPLYKSCFISWYDPPRVHTLAVGIDAKTSTEIMILAKEIYDNSNEGDWISVTTFDIDNLPIHYDFIVTKDQQSGPP